jgi:hypothetical protein
VKIKIVEKVVYKVKTIKEEDFNKTIVSPNNICNKVKKGEYNEVHKITRSI